MTLIDELIDPGLENQEKVIPISVSAGVSVPEDWRFAFVSIDKTMAQELLDIPRKNRNIRRSAVQEYTDDLKAGRWRMTPETIVLGKNGEIIDGQHRLTAVVAADAIVPFMVVSNVDAELLKVIDTGHGRSTADVLGIGGLSRPGNVATAARLLHTYLNVPYDLVWGGNHLKVLSASALEEFMSTLPPEKPSGTSYDAVSGQKHLERCVNRALQMNRRIPMPPGPLAVGLYLTSLEVPLCQQESWIGPLATGALLEGPILAFRERMRTSSSKLPPRDILAMYLAAWSAWRDGRPLRSISLPRRMPKVGLEPAALDKRRTAASKSARNNGYRAIRAWSDVEMSANAAEYIRESSEGGEEPTMIGLRRWTDDRRAAGEPRPSSSVYQLKGWDRSRLDALVVSLQERGSDAPSDGGDDAEARKIRQWGNEHGYNLNSRGRLPQEVKDRWLAEGR